MSELFLIATIAGEAVAIRSDQVESVVDIVDLVPVPRAERHVKGLAALRSRVVTVIDTAAALGFDRTMAMPARAVITEVDGHHYAMLVDALDDVQAFRPTSLGFGATLSPAWARVTTGMVERDGHPILVVDLSAILPQIAPTARAA